MAASRNFTRCLLYWILRVYACHADVVELVDTYALGANKLACLFLYFIGVI